MENNNILKADFKDFTRVVLDKSLVWLNDPEIKKLTYSTGVDKELQEKWFKRLKNRKDYFIKSIWLNEKPIGAMGIKNMTDKDGEVFIYIGEKDYWGKTIGTQGLRYIINYAKSIKLESLYAYVLKDNIRSYKLIRRVGFEKVLSNNEETIKFRLHFLTVEE